MASGGTMIKTDWYQTEATVVVTVLIKQLKEENLKVEISDKQLDVAIQLSDDEVHKINLNLAHKIVPECSSYKIMSTKVEIKLKKVDGIRWDVLEGDADIEGPKTIPIGCELSDKPPPYPTSKGTNWSAIEKEMKAEESKENPEGDEAVNSLFQKIYGQGSDEVKRAMNKSYMESGGTVLSTNWSEIGSKKVDIKPPDGLEWKKWE